METAAEAGIAVLVDALHVRAHRVGREPADQTESKSMRSRSDT